MSGLTPEQSNAGQTALADLEQTRQSAWLQVSGSWDMSGGTSKDAGLYYLSTTAPAAIAALQRQLEENRNGFARWVADATQLHNDISEVAGYSSEWSLSGVLGATLSQTGSDLETGAQSVYQAATSGTTWGIVAFLLAAFVVLKVR